MMWRVPPIARLAALLLVAAVAGACVDKMQTVEQTTQGPTGLDVLTARTVALNGREPTFDEKRYWENAAELRIAKYLREHPELQQTPRYMEVRFWRQVTPGAPKEEVLVLLDEPQERTIDPALMAMHAEHHWLDLERKAREAWVYYGWVLYFDDAAVVGMVRHVSRLEPRYD
jgi:hypothetical protein